MNLGKFGKKNTVVLLFLIALTVRIFILFFIDQNRIPPDGVGYHTIAVNIVKGHGMSIQREEPFEEYYFREPGYPYFLAGIYSIVNIFCSVQYINTSDIDMYRLNKNFPEIVTAKIVQIVLDSIGIILIFLIILNISNTKIAFYTSIVTALFFNLAFHSVYLLREPLVVPLLLLLNFLYIKYLKSEKNFIWLILIGIITGMLILTFQVHIVILPIFFILVWINSKNFKKSFIQTAIVSAIAMAIIAPHLVKVYKYYPDIKILKTFGSSFTHELIEYNRIISLLESLNLISKEEANSMRDWNKSSRIQFERSFNGYYYKKIESLKDLVPEKYKSSSFKIKSKVKAYFRNFRKSFFLTKIAYSSGNDLIDTYGILILFPLLIFPFIIGFTGIIGLVLFWRKHLIYLFPFLVYLLLFWLLGSEYRRMIILQPFLIYFGMLLINKLLGHFGINLFENNKKQFINDQIKNNSVQFN